MFSIKDFFSKCNQIRSFLQIWSHLLKKCLMESFIFCAVLLSEKNYRLYAVSKKTHLLTNNLKKVKQKTSELFGGKPIRVK